MPRRKTFIYRLSPPGSLVIPHFDDMATVVERYGLWVEVCLERHPSFSYMRMEIQL